MRVGVAKTHVSRWLQMLDLPEDVSGAILHGSIMWLEDNDELEPWSDVDIVLVGASSQSVSTGKREYGDVLLDVSFLQIDDVQTARQVLSRYDIAGSSRRPNVLLDRTGNLTVVQQAVEAQFGDRKWVEARCEDALHRVSRHLGRSATADTLSEQITYSSFAAGVLLHVFD